jgi:hypothetical protein
MSVRILIPLWALYALLATPLRGGQPAKYRLY